MLKTINQIKKEFQTLATAHDQINDFYFGNFLEAYEDHVIKHCFLLVDVLSATPVNVRGAGSYVDLQLLITVADIVFEGDNDHMAEVKSDTLQIVEDIANTFESPRWSQFCKVVGTPVATYFRQRGGDMVDGWAMPVTLRVVSVRDLCAIPYNDYDLGGVFTGGSGGTLVSQFLTCGTLADCPTIIAINDLLETTSQLAAANAANILQLDLNLQAIDEDLANITPYYDTEANLTILNPVLEPGQLAYSSDQFNTGTDQPKFKIGNGTDAWADLDYFEGGGGSQTLAQVLANGNNTGDQNIVSATSLSILRIADDYVTLVFNTQGLSLTSGALDLNHATKIGLFSELVDITATSTLNIDTPEVTFEQAGTQVNANGAEIINLPDAVQSTQPLTKGQFDSYVQSAGRQRGSIDCSTNPNYPASNTGDRWEVSVAGKIGGAAGITVQVYDEIVCKNPAGSAGGDQATAGADFYVIQGNLERATETTSGFIELATNTETQTGTDDERAITALKLANWWTYVKGLAQTFTVSITTPILKAASSAGIKIQSSAGSDCATFGAGGGQNVTFHDGVKMDGATADRIASFDSNKNITALDTATYPSLTELSYVKGVTSSIQTQLDAKKGYTLTTGQLGPLAPVDATSYYFGALITATNTTTAAGRCLLSVPKSGTLKRIDVYVMNAGAGGTLETSSVYLRLNAATDILATSSLVTNTGVNVVQKYSSGALNQSLLDTDTFEMRWDTPTWGTNPGSVRMYAILYIE